MHLTSGQPAPDFSLPDQNGINHALADYRGRYVLVYFYPKDDTPGCTTEACSFRDNLSHFEQLHTVVLGISADSADSHKKFSRKFSLHFTLLADATKKTVEHYGVWGKKNFMGREYMGTLRTSFLIDPQGKIVKIYQSVKPPQHASEVLADLAELVGRRS